jgi:hypothetical protein
MNLSLGKSSAEEPSAWRTSFARFLGFGTQTHVTKKLFAST